MKRVEAGFLAAVGATSGDRAAVLDRECGADADLRRQVERLLLAHDAPGRFLERAAAAQVRTVGEARELGPDPALRDVEPAGALIGPYKLLQKIGEGGMGVVYMAEQTQPVQRKVALKVIKPG